MTSATARLITYRAFIEDELDAPKHLSATCTRIVLCAAARGLEPRTMSSLPNAFTSSLKELDDPIPQLKATAKRGAYLEHVVGS